MTSLSFLPKTSRKCIFSKYSFKLKKNFAQKRERAIAFFHACLRAPINSERQTLQPYLCLTGFSSDRLFRINQKEEMRFFFQNHQNSDQ